MKNLRGVVLLDPEDELAPNFLRWLNRRFRYRVLGISPMMLKELARRGLSPTKQIKALHYPSNELSKLVKRLSNVFSNVPEDVIESVVMASAYVSPLIVFENYSDSILSLSAYIVKAMLKLNNALLKLHMRIADYSILDYYIKNLELLEGLWKDKLDSTEFIKLREDIIVKDSRRYWRLTTQPSKGGKKNIGRAKTPGKPRPFLAYVDLPALLIRGGKYAEIIRDFNFEDIGAGLVIVPSVIIPSYITGK